MTGGVFIFGAADAGKRRGSIGEFDADGVGAGGGMGLAVGAEGVEIGGDGLAHVFLEGFAGVGGRGPAGEVGGGGGVADVRLFDDDQVSLHAIRSA